MNFNELISHLGSVIGEEGLHADENRKVHLALDGIVVTIEDSLVMDMMIVTADFAPLPAEGGEKLYIELLKSNWVYEETGGGVLAINPDEQKLALVRYDRCGTLDGKTFVDKLEVFLNLAKKWQQLVVDYQNKVARDNEAPVDEELPKYNNDVMIFR